MLTEVLTAVTTGLAGYLVWLAQKTYTNKSASARALKALLRAEIRERHHHYVERGWITTHELDEFIDMYNAYKELGGNGTVEKMNNAVTNLPIKED